MSIQFTNFTESLYIYGIIPHIEIYYNNEWQIVPTNEDIAWTCEGYCIEPKSTCKQKIPIKYAYNLSEGNYRIILDIINDADISTTEQDYIMAEFLMQ